MNKRIIYALLLILLLYFSSVGQYLGNGSTYNSANFLAFVDIIIISFVMMIVPFILKIRNHSLFDYEKGKKICMYNSLILFGLSIITMIIWNGFYLIGGLGAFIYYFINMFLFSFPKGNLGSKIIDEDNMSINGNEEKEINLSAEDELVIRDSSNESNVDSKDAGIYKEIDKKYCTNCGKDIEKSWTFCNYCGYKLK